MAKQVPNELITSKEQSTDNQLLQIEPLIRIIRGKQVLLDSDLAILYGVETRQLNQQVRRNIERFPEDFMFQLTKVEVINLKSQIVTSSHGGVRKLPYAFTENGIAMLNRSCVPQPLFKSISALYVSSLPCAISSLPMHRYSNDLT